MKNSWIQLNNEMMKYLNEIHKKLCETRDGVFHERI